MSHAFVTTRVQWLVSDIRGVDWPAGSDGATYMYFISTSRASVPPGALYSRVSIGDMSACRMDCRISMTMARYVSCSGVEHVSLVSLGV